MASAPALAQQVALPTVMLTSTYAATSQQPGRAPVEVSRDLLPSALPTAEGPDSWACVQGARLDFMPVSFDADDAGPDAWVVVYTYRNEVVASEKVSKKDVERIKTQRCPAPSNLQVG
jgi:hypothetical protein